MQSDNLLIMQRHINYCVSKQRTHIEMFAAAFVQYVGSDKVLEYELIEETSVENLTTKWFFRKISK